LTFNRDWVEASDVNLLVVEVDVREPQVANLLCPRAMSHGEEEHGVFPWPEFLRSLHETLK
jgi:hypothetical protein